MERQWHERPRQYKESLGELPERQDIAAETVLKNPISDGQGKFDAKGSVETEQTQKRGNFEKGTPGKNSKRRNKSNRRARAQKRRTAKSKRRTRG